MKLRCHAKPDHEAASGAAGTDAAGTEPATTLALRLLISSNTGLPEQDFNAQKDMISRVAAFDSASHPVLARRQPARPARMGSRGAQYPVRGRPRARHADQRDDAPGTRDQLSTRHNAVTLSHRVRPGHQGSRGPWLGRPRHRENSGADRPPMAPASDPSGIRRELPESNDEIFRSCQSGRP